MDNSEEFKFRPSNEYTLDDKMKKSDIQIQRLILRQLFSQFIKQAEQKLAELETMSLVSIK